MSRLDQYARSLVGVLDLSAADKERIRDEAVAHMEDEAGRLMADGKSRDEAEQLAVAAFGKSDAIAALVDEALAAKQLRHRKARTLKAACIMWGLLLLAVAMGAANGLLRVVLPQAMWRALPQFTEVGLFTVMLVALALIAWRLSGTPGRAAAAAGIAVTVAYLAVVTLDAGIEKWISTLTHSAGISHLRMDIVVPLAWTALVTIAALALGRRWPGTALIAGALGAGSVLSVYIVETYGLIRITISDCLFTTGMMALQYVLLTWMLSEALEAWSRRRSLSRAGQDTPSLAGA